MITGVYIAVSNGISCMIFMIMLGSDKKKIIIIASRS